MAYATVDENEMLDMSGLGRNPFKKKKKKKSSSGSSSGDRVKWKGGKTGDISPEGVPYGMSSEEAAPILAAFNLRREAAAAGFDTVEAYRASQAPAPSASIPDTSEVSPLIAAPPATAPAPSPSPDSLETPSAVVEDAGLKLDFQTVAIGGAILLGAMYFMTRRK